MTKIFRIAACVGLFTVLGAVQAAQAQWTWSPQTGRWVNLKRMPKETPELQVQYVRTLMAEGEYKKAMRETDKFQDYYADSEFADENQYLRGEIELARKDYKDAAEEFQKVVANYPDSDLYDDVIDKQYEIGDLYYERGLKRMDGSWWRIFRKRPFRRAIDVYGMVVRNDPFTPQAAEAQYKIGLCNHRIQQYVVAADEYRRVVEDYRNSDWVDEASYGLAQCYYDASLPPEYDQSPARLAIAAVDEFQAQFPGDPRNDELAGVRVEMRSRIAEQRLQTAKFYEKRRLFDAARIYYEVLTEQFSDTPQAEEAEAWLAAQSVEGATEPAQ